MCCLKKKLLMTICQAKSIDQCGVWRVTLRETYVLVRVIFYSSSQVANRHAITRQESAETARVTTEGNGFCEQCEDGENLSLIMAGHGRFPRRRTWKCEARTSSAPRQSSGVAPSRVEDTATTSRATHQDSSARAVLRRSHISALGQNSAPDTTTYYRYYSSVACLIARIGKRSKAHVWRDAEKRERVPRRASSLHAVGQLGHNRGRQRLVLGSPERRCRHHLRGPGPRTCCKQGTGGAGQVRTRCWTR